MTASQLGAVFDVRVEFLSDWHVGTGDGRVGSIDATVRRDVDGLPFVPAKTLLGVWRDACETVAATLDGALSVPRWARWVEWIFGSQPAAPHDARSAAWLPPIAARLQVAPVRRPAPELAALRGRPELVAAAVFLRPGVEIEADTGTAKEKHLRLEERALRGTSLVTTARLDTSGAAGGAVPREAELVLRAGARFVEALGGKRTRGSGRVVVLLPGVDGAGGRRADDLPPTDSRLKQLLADDGLLADPAAPPEVAAERVVHPARALGGTPRQVWRVVLEVLSPVVAADGVLGNIITTRPEIPGTMLLGTVLPHVRREGGVGLGDVSVGDAVPAWRDPQEPDTHLPAYPPPLTWQRGGKGTGPVVYNTAVDVVPDGEQAKPGRAPVARRPDGRWQSVAVVTSVSTHAVVDDDARRPTSRGGGVFTYLGIAPGTRLVSDLVLPADAELTLKAGTPLRFGRSRKDDFGLVEVVSVERVASSTVRPVVEGAARPGVHRLRVRCLSDVLLRDDRLAPDPSPQRLAVELGRVLGVRAEVVRVDGELRPTVTDHVRRDGFVTAWGRPRPTRIGLRAGSVVTVDVHGAPPDLSRLAHLEQQGLGERTAEGFGRIAIDLPELGVRHPEVLETEPPGHERGELVDLAGVPAEPQAIELAAWRRVIRREAATASREPGKVISGIDARADRPGRAQLGALRSQLERLALPGGKALVERWFAATAATPRRAEAWGESLDAARVLVLGTEDDDQQVWRVLHLDGPRPALVLADGREDRIREALRTEAVTVLVTEVLRQVRAGERTGAASEEVDR